MLDPAGLYEVAPDAPHLDEPVLLVALDGFVDAGNAARLAVEALVEGREPRLVARFDVDQLVDYRSRRPPLRFETDHWAAYSKPELDVVALTDTADTGYLLLSGPEPDMQWERFCAAVEQIVRRFGIRLVINMTAIPMAVPHTRPIGVTAHATRPDLILGYESWLQRIQVPGSAGNLLEFRLGQAGRDALGFAVHVPHYVAQSEYPGAAELLLNSVSRTTGLLLPTERLRLAAEAVRVEIDQQVAQTDEARSLVQALEEQYDAFTRGRSGPNLLANSVGPLPTADELGAELERFLAEHGRSGETGGS